MKYELRPLKLGEMLDRALKIYLSNLGPLLGTSLALSLPVSLLQAFMQSQLAEMAGARDPNALARVLTIAFSSTVLTVLVSSIVQGALIQGVSDIYIDGKTTMGAMFGSVGARFIPLLCTAFLFGLAMVGGFMLCVIPGLIASTGFFAAQCAVMLEKKGPIESMKQSWALTQNEKSNVFTTLFVSGILVVLVSFTLGAAVGAMGLGVFWQQFVVGTLGSVFTPFAVVVTILLYYDLRIRKEGFDLQVLAREMQRTPGAPAAP